MGQRRRRDLLELLDRLNPTIAELSQAIEQEVEKCPEARRLMTHPGVGPLTALAFVLIIGEAERFQCGKQVASYLVGHVQFKLVHYLLLLQRGFSKKCQGIRVQTDIERSFHPVSEILILNLLLKPDRLNHVIRPWKQDGVLGFVQLRMA